LQVTVEKHNRKDRLVAAWITLNNFDLLSYIHLLKRELSSGVIFVPQTYRQGFDLIPEIKFAPL